MSVRKSIVEALEIRRLLTAAGEMAGVDVSFNDTTGRAIAGQWIVRLGGYDGTFGSQLKKARRLLADANAAVFVRQYLVSDGLFSVRLPTDWSVEQQLATLKQMPGFVRAEPDWLKSQQLTPNDPNFNSLTGLNQSNDQDIDAPEAWNTTTGTMEQIVGIIDSGVDYNHPDLALNTFLNQAEIPATRLANLTDVDGDGIITFRDLNNAVNIGNGKINDVNGDGRISGSDVRATMGTTSGVDNGTGGWANGIDTDANGFVDDFVGWDFFSNDNDPTDLNGHGTHVAGTVGAVGNNGIGVVGVNWKVRLMAFRTGGVSPADPSISTSAAIASLNYASMMKTRGNPVRVTNNSWGGPGFSSELQSAIQGNSNNNILFVAAAGNDGTNNDTTPQYPANYTTANVISVANLTNSGARNNGSNFGAVSVDIGAPGTNILSTTGGGYQFFTGTSMASPHVAGAAALLLSAVPSLSTAQLKSAILGNVDTIGSLNGVVASGGRLNVNKALQSVLLPAPPTPVLQPASDTGASNSDGVTNDTTPTVTGTADTGLTVRVFVNGNQVGSVAGTGGAWQFTLPVQTQGLQTVTTTLFDGTASSVSSEPLVLQIDTSAPTVSTGVFDSSSPPQRATVQFSEVLQGASLPTQITITNLITSDVIASGNLAVDFNETTRLATITFPGFNFGALPNGNYSFAVRATDVAGNLMPSAFTFNFQFLAGDATGDRAVTLNDFSRLANNFGQSPRIFTQGDFSYDGKVDLDDFTILAANFGKSIPPLADLPRQSSATGSSGAASPFASEAIGELEQERVLDLLEAEPV